jgi:hypothetical protein
MATGSDAIMQCVFRDQTVSGVLDLSQASLAIVEMLER